MGFDLTHSIKRNGVRKNAITVRPIEPTQVLEGDLYRLYWRIVAAWSAAVQNDILPEYGATVTTDSLITDSQSSLRFTLKRINDRILKLLISLNPQLLRWVKNLERWHRAKWVSVVKTATTVNLDTMIGPAAARETMGAVVARNVGLIKGLSDDISRKVTDIVWGGFSTRKPRAHIERELAEMTGMSRKRARLIARDQTTKYAAALDQERQLEAGIEEFKWRHSGKVHFRPEHKAREGNVYKWKRNSLKGDLPGVAINCGCKAQAHIPLMEEAA